jgi:hypothetical protein
LIESGDALVFGGAQRAMTHRVGKNLMNTFKHDPLFNVRVNLTFRTLNGPADAYWYTGEKYIKKEKQEQQDSE